MGHKSIQHIPTDAKESLLAHGSNFAEAPRHPSYLEYIKAKEQVCHKLRQDREELRSEKKNS